MLSVESWTLDVEDCAIVTNSKFEEIAQILREHQRFAILGHVRPDGDALGSQLALALSLQALGKEVCVWNEDGMLEKYSFLPRAEFLTKPPSIPEDFDVAIALDTAIQNRLGTALAAIRSAKIWINIDHHMSNPGYGDVVYVDSSAPATGEIIFHLIKSEGLPFNRDIAGNLYAAISTDTGSFQYPKTSARTFEIAAELIRTGLEVGAELGVLPEDNEGLIDHLRAVRGVIVAVFFEELSDGKVRVSMRSKTDAVDVCAICQKFGGGGHALAAGARVRGTLPEVEDRVLAEVGVKVKSLKSPQC